MSLLSYALDNLGICLTGFAEDEKGSSDFVFAEKVEQLGGVCRWAIIEGQCNGVGGGACGNDLPEWNVSAGNRGTYCAGADCCESDQCEGFEHDEDYVGDGRQHIM